MKYIILNPENLQILYQTKPKNFKITTYWDNTKFNPYTGRNPIGIPYTFQTKEKALKELTKYPGCILAKYIPILNQIHKL